MSKERYRIVLGLWLLGLVLLGLDPSLGLLGLWLLGLRVLDPSLVLLGLWLLGLMLLALLGRWLLRVVGLWLLVPPALLLLTLALLVIPVLALIVQKWKQLKLIRLSSYVITGLVKRILPEEWRADLNDLRHLLLVKQSLPKWLVNLHSVLFLVVVFKGWLQIKLENILSFHNRSL